MIRIDGYQVKPTIFPDGTSQVWKLPADALEPSRSTVSIEWFFEEERELIDLASLVKLAGLRSKILYLPYLPYARQDKEVSNATTFNFRVFGEMLNWLGFDQIRSVDAHNPELAAKLITGFWNVPPLNFHDSVIKKFKPSCLVFPDNGAWARYGYHATINLIGHKERDPLTGAIISYSLIGSEEQTYGNRFLIIDDICDGGRTFLEAAKQLKLMHGPDIKIGLAVTHGIFSQGRKVLEDAGIEIFTTTSILKNKDGYQL